jgi:hypothetical protein
VSLTNQDEIASKIIIAMAKLSPLEMQKLEVLFGMGSGYVLNFTNQDFARFIKRTVNLNIESGNYNEYGLSKAKRLKRLWEIEGDVTVGKLLGEMIEYYLGQIELENPNVKKVNDNTVQNCLAIASRLLGKPLGGSYESKQNNFLTKEIDETDLTSLNLVTSVISVLEQRIIEIKKGLKSGASLSVIFLCGSILEGILLNIATLNPANFNRAHSSPKDKSGKVKPFHEWSLNSLIEVSFEVGLLGLDVKKHSHSLRDFRNYIHPFEQMASGFMPDNHTAEIAWKVLKAAMHDINQKVK